MRTVNSLLRTAAFAALLPFVAAAQEEMSVDVLVVGGTTRGVEAAKAARAAGRSVYLVTPYAFLGEDLAGTLELGFDAGREPRTELERRLWRSTGGMAPFDYTPDHPSEGIRNVFNNDKWERLSEPKDPPTMDDSVLFLGDVRYDCVLRKPAKVAKVVVTVLEADSYIREDLISDKDRARLEQTKKGIRKVATASASFRFTAGPRAGETVELVRRGAVGGVPGKGMHPNGRRVVFEAEIGSEVSTGEVTVRIDPTAHHQLLSRIGFPLVSAESVMSPPSPLKVKRTYDAELVGADVGFITSTFVRRVLRDGSGALTGVETVNRSGRRTIRAKEVVDATLYGTLGKVPAVAAEESFSRIVMLDRARPSAPGMTVEELPQAFTVAHADLDGRLYRCSFSLPMADGTFPSFAAAEWAARELTKSKRTVDAADVLVWRPSPRALAEAKPLPDEPPVWGEFDVVVVGGGTSGAPAGIAAGRSGAKTLIVEYRDILGGVGTDGMVLGFFDGNKCGFTEEFNKACGRYGAQAQYRRGETWRALCREAGVTVWFGAMGLGAVREGDKVTGVEVATPFGCGIVKAKCVIDGTGNSDVAAAAGAATEFVSAAEIAVQSAGQSPHRLGRGCINSDFGYLNDADAYDLWLFCLRARAGAPDAWDIAKLPDSRERRRIVPDHRLSGEDVVANRRFPDTIAQAKSRQDPHGYLVDDFGYLSEHSTTAQHGGPEVRDMFHVNLPLRSLLPKGLRGIAAVGLGAGIHRDVVTITRMQADLMNMGYGAGVAAAMAARNGGDFRRIDLKELRKALVAKGVLREEALGWDAEDDVSSDALLAEAVRTLPDGYRGGHVVYREENRARAIPLLRQAYAGATDEAARQTYAMALGLMGDATGIETLLGCIGGQRKAIDVRKLADKGTHMFAKAYSAGWSRTGMVLALARTKDPRAVKPLLDELAKVKPGAALKPVRTIALALEALAAPEAAEPLARLLRAEGMHGHAVASFRDLKPTGGYGPIVEYDLCFRELALARALMACGDFENVGRRTYEAYAKDPRGLLSAHARAVLAR